MRRSASRRGPWARSPGGAADCGMLAGMRPSRRPLRPLHTANVHLDGDGEAAGRERDRRVLAAIVDRALADAVGLVLIAGDLFDHNRVPDETIAAARVELGRLRQPVVILPGNHDSLYPNAIYDRRDFAAGAPHVHVIRGLDGETIAFPELDAVVWGRTMAEHDLSFQPLAHIAARDDRRWCLAMGHGFFHPERQRPERSSPIFADEIRDTGWNYVALGHHHVQADVSQGGVAAWYAGAPAAAWGTGSPAAGVLRVDLAADGGIRVVPRRID
jgi:exonuclease SbcD